MYTGCAEPMGGPRNEPLPKEFTDRRFRDLDQDLFGDSQAAARSELKAFELLH